MTTTLSASDYKERLIALQSHFDKRKGSRDQIIKQKDELGVNIILKRDELAGLNETRILLEKTSVYARSYAKTKLEEIVTNALQYIFTSDFRFEIDLTESGGKPQADFFVVSLQDGIEVRNRPEDSRGGGVVDIISLALRWAVLQIHADPKMNGPMMLDEPGKHVSEDYAIKLAVFLKQMSQHFKRQIIMVTHQPHLAMSADNLFEVEIKGGKSIVSGIGAGSGVTGP